LIISLFKKGSNWPIKIDLFFIKLISSLDGQLTFKIISDFSNTSFAEFSKLAPLFLYSSSVIPRCSPYFFSRKTEKFKLINFLPFLE